MAQSSCPPRFPFAWLLGGESTHLWCWECVWVMPYWVLVGRGRALLERLEKFPWAPASPKFSRSLQGSFHSLPQKRQESSLGAR